VGSLKDFDKLCNISVTPGVLLPEVRSFNQFVDKLPPCLERLWISGGHEALFPALYHLAQTCQEDFPKLRQVEVPLGLWRRLGPNEKRANEGVEKYLKKKAFGLSCLTHLVEATRQICLVDQKPDGKLLCGPMINYV
jgi:hypothetical protein